ncbi:hypothetical protein CNMCM5623_007470 [Aspergillus felis]|uniref:Non-canonical purine NTP pyrophosphatase n=1 Tax=Aspergillus felis TaxID=1287682 RepID=A0A8H6QNN8_9EURO|nr:hypothetical protein CNMCM5623_007470 [Aspergillus felis]KAF7175116.1 hypothetical protein CNMCM7691_006520 [Aspergillus felis]
MAHVEPPLVHFVTASPRKFAEAKAILGNVARLRQHVIELPEIQGPLEEIAREKCRPAPTTTQGAVLTEDSAPEFGAQNGLPGPYMGAKESLCSSAVQWTLTSAYPTENSSILHLEILDSVSF